VSSWERVGAEIRRKENAVMRESECSALCSICILCLACVRGRVRAYQCFHLSLPLVLLRSSSTLVFVHTTHSPTHPLHTQMCVCVLPTSAQSVVSHSLWTPYVKKKTVIQQIRANQTTSAEHGLLFLFHRIYYMCTHTRTNTHTYTHPY
jgi:hypothetical protein